MVTVLETKVGKRTVMYSVEKIEKKDAKGRGIGEFENRVVEHHLPWVSKVEEDGKDYGMMKLQRFVARGFTFEKPVLGSTAQEMDVAPELVEIPVPPPPVENESTEVKVAETSTEVRCPEPGCDFVAKNMFGLNSHTRKHYPDGVKRGRKGKRKK